MPAIFNDATDDQIVAERIESFGGGVDMYRRATLIDPDQSQLFTNVLVRENLEAWTRPGINKLTNPPNSATVNALFYFDTPNVQQLLHIQSGKIYKWDGATDAQIAGYLPAGNNFDMAQGVDNMLITDGSGNMKLYNGSVFTDGGATANDPPKGCSILCWHTIRMFAAGHPVFNDTVWVSTRLAFGAGQWNTTTRSFRVGGGEGDPIIAMASMQDFILCVLKRNSIHLVATDPTAEPANFSDSQATNPMPVGIGCVGKKAWVNVGNDLFFYSQDGVRSVQRMVAAAGQYQLSTPLSQPIQPYIDRVNKNAWETIFAVKRFEIVMFFVPLDVAATPDTVLVYHSRLGKWLGAWTGWTGTCAVETFFDSNPSQLIIGDSVGRINKWLDLSSKTDDSTYLDNGTPYGTTLWTRGFLCGEPVNGKQAYNSIFRFSAGNTTVNIGLVTDNAEAINFSSTFTPTGDILGTGTLPFLLSSTKPSLIQRSLLALPEWNSSYLTLQTSQGFFGLLNVTLNAFVNSLNQFEGAE